MVYKAKSLRGAERRVRELLKQRDECDELISRLAAERNRALEERNLLAKLAARGPAFFNPLEVMALEKLRDQILCDVWKMNPDGSPIVDGDAQ